MMRISPRFSPSHYHARESYLQRTKNSIWSPKKLSSWSLLAYRIAIFVPFIIVLCVASVAIGLRKISDPNQFATRTSPQKSESAPKLPWLIFAVSVVVAGIYLWKGIPQPPDPPIPPIPPNVPNLWAFYNRIVRNFLSHLKTIECITFFSFSMLSISACCFIRYQRRAIFINSTPTRKVENLPPSEKTDDSMEVSVEEVQKREIPVFTKLELTEPPIGCGSDGRVYKIQLEQKGKLKDVVVKILSRPNVAAEEISRMQITKEYRKHGLPKLLGVYKPESSVIGYVSPYYGVSLIEHILKLARSRQILPLKDFFEITKQCLNALSVIHRLGIVHADVRDSNLMIKQKKGQKVLRVHLIDWSISFKEGTAPVISEVQRMFERAPEVILWGNAYVDSKEPIPEITTAIDIWSLGQNLAELYSLPFYSADFLKNLKSFLKYQQLSAKQDHSPPSREQIDSDQLAEMQKMVGKSFDQSFLITSKNWSRIAQFFTPHLKPKEDRASFSQAGQSASPAPSCSVPSPTPHEQRTVRQSIVDIAREKSDPPDLAASFATLIERMLDVDYRTRITADEALHTIKS